jgi:hypothetical protein
MHIEAVIHIFMFSVKILKFLAAHLPLVKILDRASDSESEITNLLHVQTMLID